MPELDKDYKLTPESKTEYDKKQEATGIPIYLEKLELDDETKKRLVKEVFDELDVIKEQRETDKLEQKWDALDRQYEGKLDEDTRRMFNLSKQTTKVKIDKAVNMELDALFQSDPIYAVTPRPEFAKNYGIEICQAQQDFLDYKLDVLPFRQGIEPVLHSSNLKGTGWLKIVHDIKQVDRKREERYTDLAEFLRNWPDAMIDYPGLVKRLQEGKEITIIAEYKDTIKNDPGFKAVDLKNFYCRTNVDGYDGLKSTQLTAERIAYTYWELRQEEAKGTLFDIDKLIEDEKAEDKKVKNYQTKTFNILECVYSARLKESDKKCTKIVLWIDEEKKCIIGSILYPWMMIDCYYLPFYVKYKKAGCIYQPGIGEDLTDNNIAESVILNVMLESAYINNLITPLTKDEDVIAQFNENRFTPGLPIHGKPGDVDFLQKYQKPPDINGLMNVLYYIQQSNDDVSKVTSAMSGRESPIDPDAPASKTIALLQYSQVDIQAYLKNLAPSFNEIGYILLNMYYQISKEGVKYRIGAERVVGGDPFGVMERSDLIARTAIQTMAYAYSFEKNQENAKDLALYQTIRMEPLIARNPEAVHLMLKHIINSWSEKWKNIGDKLMPSVEDLKKQEYAIVLQAVVQYIQAVVQDAKVTGTQPQFNLQALLPMVNDLKAGLATAPDPEAIKAQQEQANVQA